MKPFTLQVRFGDRQLPRTYLSPDVRRNNPGWGDEKFNRPVEELMFFLPNGRFIVMTGMEAYNFFIEGVQDFSKRGRSVKLQAIYIAGKIPNGNKVVMWKIDRDQISFNGELEFKKEYNGTATRGWKQGIIGSKPDTKMVGLNHG